MNSLISIVCGVGLSLISCSGSSEGSDSYRTEAEDNCIKLQGIYSFDAKRDPTALCEFKELATHIQCDAWRLTSGICVLRNEAQDKKLCAYPMNRDGCRVNLFDVWWSQAGSNR